MSKFKLGQAVRVIRGKEEVFCGRISEIHDPGPIYYRVEDEYKGQVFAMTVEEAWLEAYGKPEESCPATAFQTACLASSLKSLVFSIGGTHVAGWVEEAEKAAREGRTVKYE